MEKKETSTVKDAIEIEDMFSFFDEHTQNLVEAVQQEKEKLRTQAVEESRKIISEAEQKAKQIIMEAIEVAENKSAEVLTKSIELVNVIVDIAEGSKKAVDELKENVEKDIEAAKVKLQREVDIINEIINETEKTVNQATDKLQYQFEESVKTVNEAKNELEQIRKDIESTTYKENGYLNESHNPSEDTTTDTEENGELTEVRVHDQSNDQHDDGTFVGTKVLEVFSQRPNDYKRLQEHLSKIVNLEVLSVDDTKEDKKMITVFLGKPLPLINILNGMALVTKAGTYKGCIRVDLGKGYL